MRADILDKVNRATEAVIAVHGRLRYLRHVTPDNLASVRAWFLSRYPSDEAIDPIFEYTKPVPDVADAIREAVEVLPPDQPWRALLDAQLESARRAYVALLSRNAAEMTAYAVHQYGTPDEAIAATASRGLADTADVAGPDGDADVWSAFRAQSVLGAVLHHIGMTDWSTEVTQQMAARMSVSAHERRVRVRKDATFTTAEVRRLIVHEIGTHVFRYANANRQPLKLLTMGTAGGLFTEEGLAAWHEEDAGLSGPHDRRRYALRYLASSAALRCGFRAVMDELVTHTTVAEAFDITARIKRGIIDTSAPGGFVKDQVYFGGLAEVRAHMAGSPEDHELLMATKWPLRQVPLLRELYAEKTLVSPVYRVDQAVELAHKLTALP